MDWLEIFAAYSQSNSVNVSKTFCNEHVPVVLIKPHYIRQRQKWPDMVLTWDFCKVNLVISLASVVNLIYKIQLTDDARLLDIVCSCYTVSRESHY